MKNFLKIRKTDVGFTLLEVLIALVVFSIGLLGLAGLQTVSLRNTASSSSRTIATQLAYDIADRMRANSVGVVNGNYLQAATTIGAAPANCYTSAGCTAANMAAMDLFAWRTRLARELNGGLGVVCRDSSAPETVSVSAGVVTDPGCDNAVGSPIYVKIFWSDRDERNVNGGAFTNFVLVSSVQP
jgi:type IV pilus assembly protein PilV